MSIDSLHSFALGRNGSLRVWLDPILFTLGVGQTSVCGGLQPASDKRCEICDRRTEVRRRLKPAPPKAAGDAR